MSDNKTDALRNQLIVLAFIFILFLIAVFLAFAKGDRTTILPGNLQPPKHWKAQVSPL